MGDTTAPSGSSGPSVTDVVDSDLVLLVQACAAVLGSATLEGVRRGVGPDVRFHDGYVFQHLLAGPCTVSQLADRLGVSQQAASKQVADLLARRLVTRRRSPEDGRAWLIRLSARGRRTVEEGRRVRAELAEECTSVLGPEGFDALMESLRALSGHLGAARTMAERRLAAEAVR